MCLQSFSNHDGQANLPIPSLHQILLPFICLLPSRELTNISPPDKTCLKMTFLEINLSYLGKRKIIYPGNQPIQGLNLILLFADAFFMFDPSAPSWEALS